MQTAFGGLVYDSSLCQKALWVRAAATDASSSLSMQELRMLLVRVLQQSVLLALNGNKPIPFGELCQNQLLSTKEARAPALTGLSDLAVALRSAPETSTVASVLRVLVGLVSSAERPFSILASELVTHMAVKLCKVEVGAAAAQVSQALSVFEDSNSTTDLASAVVAVEYAVQAAGFMTVCGREVLDSKFKEYFGASEGSVSLDKLLEFMLELHFAEETAATARLSARFAIAGVEAPAIASVNCRQISHQEWLTVTSELCDGMGYAPEVTKPCFEQIYWKCTMTDGTADLSVGSFVEAFKEARLHRRCVAAK